MSMKTTTGRLYGALQDELRAITAQQTSPAEQYSASIRLCKKAMTKLKNFTAGYAFENTAEEVDFFKNIKPLFYSLYIYFINVYNFTIKTPPGSEEALRNYIQDHLAELKTFFDHNTAFYQYYRAGSTHQDTAYFTRGGFDVHVELEDFEEDEQYSTSHDYKLSKITANEKFRDYLNYELARIGNEDLLLNSQKIFPFNHPNWTASQTDAVELIYSLKTSGAINHGNIEISELVAIFEFVFQTELNETYHKFLDIGRRKKDMFIFLNRLKNSFQNFINDKLSLVLLLGFFATILYCSL